MKSCKDCFLTLNRIKQTTNKKYIWKISKYLNIRNIHINNPEVKEKKSQEKIEVL